MIYIVNKHMYQFLQELRSLIL